MAYDAKGWDEDLHKVMRRMLDSSSCFTTPISISLNNDMTGKHLGTGSFVDIGPIAVLLSCEHVLGFRRTNRLAHRFLGRDHYFLIDGAGAYAPEPVDAAVAVVSREAFEEPWCRSRAIPLDRFAAKHDPEPDEIFFVHGFAVENSQFVYDTLRTDGTAYLCREVPLPGDPRMIPEVHFALEYRRDIAVRSFGDHDLPDPHGMSGSVVWNTKYRQCAVEKREWSPDQAVVTGLLWAWPHESRIIATRVEYLREFFSSIEHSWSDAANAPPLTAPDDTAVPKPSGASGPCE
ncbi:MULTISPECIES: hypothetical protein [unclassified Bradyrhizobium]|uniref:hypothetical protein n=1 Tax=unclassified Bradyrhizobium TaxID=2631580 RepID=UPI0029161617|nr:MULTISPECIES: hypothetical protein [unclassified Bradyrhizobium]